MRKWLTLLPVVVLAVIALSVARASTAATNSGADVYGVGGGSIGFAGAKHLEQFDLSGHTGPNGDFGHVGFAINDPNFPLDTYVDLDCVNVFPVPLTNGGAWLIGPVKKVSPEPNAYGITTGTRLAFYIVDGGEPSAAAPVDEFEAFYAGTASCKTLPSFGYFPDVTQGNINVKTG